LKNYLIQAETIRRPYN